MPGLRVVTRRDPRFRRALMPAAVAMLAACGQVQVRPLATGVPDRAAYELSGPSLEGLRSEARHLCKAGADVLRAAERVDGGHPVRTPSDSWYGRWWQTSQAGLERLAPANREAQLMVLCQPDPSLASLAALPPAVSIPAPSTGSAAKDAEGGGPAEFGRDRPARGGGPVGEGDVRGGFQARYPGTVTPPAAADRSAARTNLRSGMTAALPAGAVSSGRAGRAPGAASVAGSARAPASSAVGGSPAPDAEATTVRAPRARAASSPILSY